MATITLTITNAVANRFTKAIGYKSTLSDGSANPQTALDAAKSWLINDMKQIIKQSEGSTVAQTAINTNDADIDTNIIIT